MPIQNPSDIRLNEQNDLEAIIGHPPGWALRWGMTVLFGVLGLLLLIAWLVRYPDIVEARAVLTTEHPPIRMVAKASGALAELRVKDGQSVQAKEIIGVLDNPAKLEDIERLEIFLENLSENRPDSYLAIDAPKQLQLGNLEAMHAQFSQRFSELKHFLEQDINYLKISNLRKQILEIERLNRSLERQTAILAEEVEVAHAGFARDSILLSQNSLSELELEATKTVWLRRRRELESLRSGTVQNALSIRQMEAKILDLQQLRSDDESELQLNFKSEIERLQGEIEVWKDTWLLTAPITGEVALTNAWSKNQFIEEGMEVLTIVPQAEAGKVFGKAFLTGEGLGKVGEGMTAYLRLDGFPYQEYGVLNAELRSISEVPGAQGYEAQLTLTNGMVTSHDRPIPFRQEMQATARIVTQERSLLKRLLERIWGVVEQN